VLLPVGCCIIANCMNSLDCTLHMQKNLMAFLFFLIKFCNCMRIFQVDFHDTGRGPRVPSMTDYFGFTMAALNESGSVFANPCKGDKNMSTLMYRPFGSWAGNSEICYLQVVFVIQVEQMAILNFTAVYRLLIQVIILFKLVVNEI